MFGFLWFTRCWMGNDGVSLVWEDLLWKNMFVRTCKVWDVRFRDFLGLRRLIMESVFFLGFYTGGKYGARAAQADTQRCPKGCPSIKQGYPSAYTHTTENIEMHMRFIILHIHTLTPLLSISRFAFAPPLASPKPWTATLIPPSRSSDRL